LDFANRALRNESDDRWAVEARCERGEAQMRLGRLEDAECDLAVAAATDQPALAARARFLLGEIQRRRGQTDDAIRAYFQVARSQAADAPEPVRHWQAEATFAAAECLEQTNRRDAARKLYAELLERFPASARAREARVALDGSTRR
jgi:TolA-binding protein